MSSVTYPALSGTITASQLNTNFSDVVSLASSIGNDQLAGGITADKLSDRYSVTYDTITLVPGVFTIDSGGPGTDTIEGTNEVLVGNSGSDSVDYMQWQPIMRAGMEAYLCSINIYVKTNTNSPQIRFYLNGSSTSGALIGGAAITLSADNTLYTLGQTDPIANPLIAMTNGDYITVNFYANTSATAALRGCYATLCMKYVLQA
jgi:hypothetical protein